MAAARLRLVKQERDIGLKVLALEAGQFRMGGTHGARPGGAETGVGETFEPANCASRVQMGEAQLMDVRSRDGGWNYGSPAALGVDLPSYPETTALALVALQGARAIWARRSTWRGGKWARRRRRWRARG